ncbi:MAG: PadR family transcriptional regulator [Acidimicrobiales bacterium]
MTRVFRPHELKQAVLEALQDHGPANGYTLMQVLAERIGSNWRPSPGAVYPALLALEDLGLIGATANEGGRTYHVEPTGSAVVARDPGTLDRVGQRARSIRPQTEVGTLLDRFAKDHPDRRRVTNATEAHRIEALLAGTAQKINTLMTPKEPR